MEPEQRLKRANLVLKTLQRAHLKAISLIELVYSLNRALIEPGRSLNRALIEP
jgi:hypothetical protein